MNACCAVAWANSAGEAGFESGGFGAFVVVPGWSDGVALRASQPAVPRAPDAGTPRGR